MDLKLVSVHQEAVRGGVAGDLLYRYVNIPAFGSFPAMYEPVWYVEKTLSAVAKAAGFALAVFAFFRLRRRARRHSQ